MNANLDQVFSLGRGIGSGTISGWPAAHVSYRYVSRYYVLLQSSVQIGKQGSDSH